MTDRLPIYEVEDQIIARLQENRRLILQAPNGSGKSSQVPQMLLNRGLVKDGQVLVLEPRRLPARLLAARVAKERNVEVGAEVGYEIPFESVAGAATRIKYITGGLLLQQLLQDPQLQGVQALVFDDFQERHLDSDLTLSRALEAQEKSRPDLLIIVMSATPSDGALETFMQPCSVLVSESRTFPVETDYVPHKKKEKDKEKEESEEPVWEMAAEAFKKHVQGKNAGDVLVFMPGRYEIEQTIEAIRALPEAQGFLLLPLHCELSPQDQEAAVARYDQPKVVVSTNVAETSLTIDGVRLVIDSGLARIPKYDASTGINTRLVEKISRASADQRSGRAGRTAAGRVVRLWSSQDHWERPEHTDPEVKRLDLSEVALTLKSAGIEDLRTFRWLEAPTEEALERSEQLLIDLGALEAIEPAAASETPVPAPAGTPAEGTTTAPAATSADKPRPVKGRLTDLGRRMAAFPVHPRYSRMFLAAQGYDCTYHACLVAALTQGRELLMRSPGKAILTLREELLGHKGSSDFWIAMRAWDYARDNEYRVDVCRKVGIHAVTARQVGPLFEEFQKVARSQGLHVDQKSPAPDTLEKCILIAFPDRVARRLDEGTLRCEMVGARRGNLARESVVHHSTLLVASEVREVEGADKTLATILSWATATTLDWLREFFPRAVRTESRVFFDSAARRVSADEQVRFRDLVVTTRRNDPAPADEATRILATEVSQKRLTLRNWDASVEEWILRLNLLSRWSPDLGLTPLAEDDRYQLIEQICQGGYSYKDIKDREVKLVVQSWLSKAQQELLEKHAPERFAFSNGKSAKIHYLKEGQPYIEVRIQDLYGVKTTPKIASGKVTLQVHILAPNMRPIQVTQDLVSFWREHYPKAKKELQRKYPKHEWR